MSSRKGRLDAESLYQLLPAVYRQKDMEVGQPLRALMAVIEEQMRAIESDIDGLYENWFIETCQEWALPYIGDLLGIGNLRQTTTASEAFSQRAYVANTQAYRRRKGTGFVLEQVARDVTGWPVRVREFYTLLARTQNINYVRQSSPATLDIKDAGRLERLGGPFEDGAHTVQVGRIGNGSDRYNLKNLGLFFWRLNSYAIAKADACRFKDDSGNLHDNLLFMSPLGIDMQLFNCPKKEPDMSHLAEEINVPGRLSIRALQDEIRRRRASLEIGETPVESYFGEEPAFQIFLDNRPVLPEEMVICSLGDWQKIGPQEGGCSPFGNHKYVRKKNGKIEYYKCAVAVDPEAGRIMLPDGGADRRNEDGTASRQRYPVVHVSFSYGFGGEVGGGPYNCTGHLREWMELPGWERLKDGGVSQEIGAFVQEVSREEKNLIEALSDWNEYARQRSDSIGIIIISDSSSIQAERILIEMPPDSRLAIIAAAWPKTQDGQWLMENIRPEGVRPHIKADLRINGQTSSELILSGLLIDGKVELLSSIGRLGLSDCTIYPEKGGLYALSEADGSLIEMNSCICGPINLQNKFSRLEMKETIADGLSAANGKGEFNGYCGSAMAISGAGTELKIKACTVLGETVARAMQAEDSIFTGRVAVKRVQAGCIRFCYLPPDSVAPRRYRCQPDMALTGLKELEEAHEKRKSILQRLAPAFTSRHYGHPGYCQLSLRTPVGILRGSEDRSEMGAFSGNKQTQRLEDLEDCLDEYLPFGLNAGIFFVD